MFNFDFLIDTLLLLPGILIGITFHEFAHAFVSDRLGDPTPRATGRLSLSPTAHIDPVGFLMLLLFRFGWAKPVQIDTRYYKKPIRDENLVSLAGVVTNLLLAILFTGFYKIFITFVIPSISTLDTNILIVFLKLFNYTIYINLVLCIFNLIPIPPLDGSHILMNILPIRNTRAGYILERYGMYILIGLIVLPTFFGFSILTPIIDFPLNLLSWIFGISAPFM
ncbi:MAG: site-2 protease family protein [Clostridia bacterium]|jgi:Zn-dependent protease